jgi:hypothetical protein
MKKLWWRLYRCVDTDAILVYGINSFGWATSCATGGDGAFFRLSKNLWWKAT